VFVFGDILTARLTAPVVTICINRSCSKIQNQDILVPANPDPPGKWRLNRRERERQYETVWCLPALGDLMLFIWHLPSSLQTFYSHQSQRFFFLRVLAVKDDVGRPPAELGVIKSMECDIYTQHGQCIYISANPYDSVSLKY